MEPFDYQPTLKGEILQLRPLDAVDFEELFAVASNPKVWEQHPRWDRYKEEVFQPFFEAALESGGALVALDPKTEIGFTFLGTVYWGETYNGEMKSLMLNHAFQWVDSVVFLVGPTNLRSQKSVEKIGAVRDGERTDATGLDAWVYRVWKC